jgi:hypothetical protein
MGGTREGVLTAINDAWPQAIDFLARNLAPADASAAR